MAFSTSRNPQSPILLVLFVLLACSFVAATWARQYMHFDAYGRGGLAAPVDGCHKDSDCLAGGVCEKATGICNCAPGYTYPNCTIPVCENGGSKDSLDHCYCADGWQGATCQMCTSDDACIRSMNLTDGQTAFCEQSYLMSAGGSKQFACAVTSELMITYLGNETDFSCSNVIFGNAFPGHCTMTSFAYYTEDRGLEPLNKRVEVLSCVLNKCRAETVKDKPKNLKYRCLETNCQCNPNTELCNDDLKDLIDSIRGDSSVECETDTKKCVMIPGSGGGETATIELMCLGGQCQNTTIPPLPVEPDDSAQLIIRASIIASFAVMLLLLVLMIVSISSCLHTSSARNEWSIIKDKSHGASLEFRNISYYLRVKEGDRVFDKKLLKHVSHVIRPGHVVALMGPSGAGKSTLLDILANRNKKGKVVGEILVNGKPIDESYHRLSGYVFQDDNLMGTMTVRETLMFAANLKLPDCLTHAEKTQRVNETMSMLGISHIAERHIGDALHRGISGGEKRRVSIGMELIASPHILFLDEPTSGLDANSAVQVVQCLTRLAKQDGRTIVFSIHQPRSNIFAQFDEVILLSGGHIAYAGSARDSVEYFEKLGYHCPPLTNAADFLIDVLAQAQDERKTLIFNPTETAATQFNQIEQFKENSHYQSIDSGSLTHQPGDSQVAALEQGEPNLDQAHGQIYQEKLIPYATSFYSQLFVLSKRAFLNFIRNFFLMPAHYLSAIVIGFLLGCVYFNLGVNLKGCQNRVGVLFFMLSIQAFTAMSSLELFIAERAIYVREKANGYYRPMSYFFSKVLFDIIPLRIVPPILMGCVCYWMIGLHPTLENFAWFLFLMVLFNLVSGAMCIMVGSIAPSVASGNIIATLLILTQSLFAGYMVNKKSMPVFLSWIQYLSFWNYSFEALLVNELYNIDIIIDPDGSPYVFTGKGEFVLNLLGMNRKNFYTDVYITIGFAVFFIILSGLLLKFFVREKR